MTRDVIPATIAGIPTDRLRLGILAMLLVTLIVGVSVLWMQGIYDDQPNSHGSPAAAPSAAVHVGGPARLVSGAGSVVVKGDTGSFIALDGTAVTLIDVGVFDGTRRVRVTDGQWAGRTGWVPYESVK